MKLQLNETTLNAYINEAIKVELTENNMDELLGSRNRKKNIRAITGQGWGNQNRDTKNFWGAANSDISATDAESETPQTLVGIVTKMEKQLMKLEKVVGVAPQAENLGASITQTRNNGKVKVKASLLMAINALSRIADRLSVVEKQTGMNSIMESINEDPSKLTVGILGAKKLAKNLEKWGYKLIDGKWLDSNGLPAINSTHKNIALAAKRSENMIAKNPGLLARAGAAVKGAMGRTAAQTATKLGGALVKAGGLVGGTTVGAGVVVVAGIAAACFGIAQAAATIATKGRSRNIVRTFNCASVLAKRMGNVAEAYKEKLDAQEGIQDPSKQGGSEKINELNVRRAKKNFGSIEQGMEKLSALMRDINNGISGQGQENNNLQMPKSLNTPQEIKQFQEWANANGYVGKNGQQLVSDGIFGVQTNYVYDQVAQKIGQLQESRMPINEAGGIENALKTLERKVGTTGTGGAAYADISSLSGGQGQGSSRLQNAQNAKMIMRTYPPVLNQYLQTLKSAGANVNNLLPLRDDQRPHRNYSVKELQMIDRRIQELIQVAQSFGAHEREENITLPPKPRISKPVPKPKPQSTQPGPAQTQSEEPQKPRAIDTPLRNIYTSKMNLPGGASQLNTSDLKVNRPQPTLAQNTVSQMVKTATANPGTASQREKNTALRQQRDNTLNTIKSDSYAGDKKGDTKFVKDAYRNIRRGNNYPTLQENKLSLSEKELQAYINEAIKQEIENIK